MPDDQSFRILVQRQNMTGAERAWVAHYEINEEVRYSRGSKAAGIEAGTYVVNQPENPLTEDRGSGDYVTYDPRRLAGVSAYREVTHDFSVKDRIHFSAPDETIALPFVIWPQLRSSPRKSAFPPGSKMGGKSRSMR